MTTDETTPDTEQEPPAGEAEQEEGSRSLRQTLRPFLPLAVGLVVAVVVGQLIRQKVRNANQRSWKRHPLRKAVVLAGLWRLTRR